MRSLRQGHLQTKHNKFGSYLEDVGDVGDDDSGELDGADELDVDLAALLDEAAAVGPSLHQVQGGQVLNLVPLARRLVDKQLVGRRDHRAVQLARPVAQPVQSQWVTFLNSLAGY